VREKLLNRVQWCELGRVVAVENSEAKAVVNFWKPNVRGARHVFAESQTIPLAQFMQESVAA